MRAFIRWFFETLVRLYYPGIAVEGRERVPTGRSLLFVANHPNALLDPLVLRVGLGLPVRFLGKSTLFKNPLSRLTMESFGGIPVYRPRDAAAGGGDTSQNEKTFALCREALSRGEPMALFPEGTSHSDPELRPFKTGAARIALSARAAYGPSLALAGPPPGAEPASPTVTPDTGATTTPDTGAQAATNGAPASAQPSLPVAGSAITSGAGSVTSAAGGSTTTLASSKP